MATKIKSTPVSDKPTRESVQQLLAELIPNKYGWRDELEEHPDLLEVDQRIKDRRDELEGDAKLIKLESEKERIKRRLTTEMRRKAMLAKKVSREFYAKGLTPEVENKLAELVKEVNAMENKR